MLLVNIVKSPLYILQAPPAIHENNPYFLKASLTNCMD
jgi:hypothetical protein